MESFSRGALCALAAVTTGLAAAYAVYAGLGPFLVVAATPETGGGLVEGLGALLVGLLVGGVLTAVLALLAGAGATVLASRWLGRRPASGGGALVP